MDSRFAVLRHPGGDGLPLCLELGRKTHAPRSAAFCVRISTIAKMVAAVVMADEAKA